MAIEERKFHPATDERDWIIPEDQDEADRFIAGLTDAIADIDATIAELEGAIDALRAERRHAIARKLDLEKWTW
jgi:hypothetical protein